MNFVFQNLIKYKRNVQLKNLLIKVNQFNNLNFQDFLYIFHVLSQFPTVLFD